MLMWVFVCVSVDDDAVVVCIVDDDWCDDVVVCVPSSHSRATHAPTVSGF